MNESNRRRVLAGTCAALVSAFLLFAIVSYATDSGKPTHGEIAATGFLAVLHAGLTIGAVFGITHLVRHRADRLGLFGAALMFLGTTVGARIGVLIQLALIGPDTPRETMTALARSAPSVWASIVPVGLTYPLGLITLGIALFIARYRSIGLLMVIGGVFFPLGRALDIMPAVYVSDAFMAVAYGWLAKEMLTRWEGHHAPATQLQMA